MKYSTTMANNLNNENAISKCSNWLKNCHLNDSDCDSISTISSYSEESFLSKSTDNSALESGFIFSDNGIVVSNDIVCNNSQDHSMDINNVFKRKQPHYEKIQIYKSKKVHIGDVTYINGPIYVNQYKSTISNPLGTFPIIDRRNWLAQPPVDEIEYLKEPAKLVIICHSATEEAFTQADNILIVRLIQMFHIESRKWDDIAYNFLIGADGSVFEGRGWGVVGAHTQGYNRFSIGIAFVGCYTQHLPPPIALEKAKALIEHGIKIGHIDNNYSLLAHCQCKSFESPGKKLFEELKTWNNWDETISVQNPPPVIKKR